MWQASRGSSQHCSEYSVLHSSLNSSWHCCETKLLHQVMQIFRLPGHARCGTSDGPSSRTVLRTRSCTGEKSTLDVAQYQASQKSHLRVVLGLTRGAVLRMTLVLVLLHTNLSKTKMDIKLAAATCSLCVSQ